MGRIHAPATAGRLTRGSSLICGIVSRVMYPSHRTALFIGLFEQKNGSNYLTTRLESKLYQPGTSVCVCEQARAIPGCWLTHPFNALQAGLSVNDKACSRPAMGMPNSRETVSMSHRQARQDDTWRCLCRWHNSVDRLVSRFRARYQAEHCACARFSSIFRCGPSTRTVAMKIRPQISIL